MEAGSRKPGAITALEALGAFVLVLVMLVVLVDVVGRNALNHPLPWGTELVEILIAVLVFALYPVLAWRGNNITVDLVPVHRRLQPLQRSLSCLVGAGLFGVIAWCVGRQAMRAAEYGESSSVLHVPTAWVLWGVSAMAAVTALAFLAHLWVAARGAQAPAAPGAMPPAGAAPVLE